MALNVGPAHPATHGALRFFVELDGETITEAATEIGYLHRAFEKHSSIALGARSSRTRPAELLLVPLEQRGLLLRRRKVCSDTRIPERAKVSSA
jgi:hypothetical protein